ncbi:MAG: carboxymuconolactone decarboxylase family protein [Spirochaetales bacterium]|nr:carboxymuconolactone decarboxylase family protein [Spirochaetales bacterium]
MAYINEPAKIPWYLRLGIRIAEKKTGKKMLPGRLLSWYPKAAIGSGVLESLVAHNDKEVSRRLLKLIRVQVSFASSCTFCIDMNSFEFEQTGISEDEILYLQNTEKECGSISVEEKCALEYVRELTATPISIKKRTLDKLKSYYSDRAIVIIASTAAQVNFWTRLIQGLGIPPAGFNESCSVLNLDKFGTLKTDEETK